MGSKRDTIVPEVECLPQEDLVDLYQKLADSYRTKKYENEEFLQQLHYLSQQSKVLVSSQNDLQQELENINTIHNEEIENLERKNVGIVENLREKSNELFNDKVYLESRVDELTSNLDELRKELTDVKLKLVQQKPAARVSDGFSRNLETENEQLQRLLNEATETVQESHSQRSVQASKIEELKEKLLCLEDNLETKKAEIEEKNDAIEGLQEKNNELTVEIAMLKSAPDEGGQKVLPSNFTFLVINHFSFYFRSQGKLTVRWGWWPTSKDEINSSRRTFSLPWHEEILQCQGNGNSPA